MPLCHCKTFKCGGADIPRKDKRRHADMDASCPEQQGPLDDEIVREVFKVALGDEISTGCSYGEAMWARDADLPAVAADAPQSESPTAAEPKQCAVDPDGPYLRLWKIDYDLLAHANKVQELILKSEKLAIAQAPRLEMAAEEDWMLSARRDVAKIPAVSDMAPTDLRAAMLNNIDKQLQIIRKWQEGIAKPSPAFDTDRHFNHPLQDRHPLILLSIFLVLVLNVLGHVARPSCRFALKMLQKIIHCSFALSKEQPTYISFLLKNFPTDIRTVRRAFDLEPRTTTYATCPKCCCTYPPTNTNGIQSYPMRCDARPFPDSKPCGTRLTTTGVQRDYSVRKPLRPFTVQDLDDFVGGLICRPGIEAAIKQRLEWGQKTVMSDISDASGLFDVLDEDGVPFVLGGTEPSDLRLVWNISVDFFNPFLNKAAGKSVSTGSIVLSCPLLPPSIRYKPENLYLMGVIPGPREPKKEQIDHFLRPLVESMKRAWKDGTRYSRTYEYPRGRLSRSAIVLSVNDLPMARKLSGRASWPAKHFCSICHLPKEEINNVDWKSWPMRTYEDVKRAALEWKAAPNQAARNRLYKQTGVRWSVMMELPYWNSITMVVVDAMHNLWLGLIQYHFRHVLGLDIADTGETKTDISQQLARARSLLSSNGSISALKRINMKALKALCEEFKVTPRPQGDGKVRKLDLIRALLSHASTSVEQSTNPVPQRPVEHVLLGDGIVDEIVEDQARPVTSTTGRLTKDEIQVIREGIAATIRPQWHASPPLNLGEAAHGKLKADIWRSCIEFDLPVSILRIYVSDSDRWDPATAERRRLLVHSTMVLAIAIRWGTSHQTSKTHVSKYLEAMTEYLRTLRQLQPEVSLRPNHHNALHVGIFLLRFGPTHGWWMFPFERVIGMLQGYKTNSKLGQMETTMLTSFCAASNIKTFLQRPGCPDVLEDCAPLIRECFDDDERGTLLSDMRILGYNVENTVHPLERPGCRGTLQDDISCVLQTAEDQLKGELGIRSIPRDASIFDRTYIGGMPFAAFHKSRRHSSVFYQESERSAELIPGVIRQIFSVKCPNNADEGMTNHTFLAISPLSPAIARTNPFLLYPSFGANLWASAPTDDIRIIPSTRKIYNSISLEWAPGVRVMKPLNRVSLTSS